MDAPIAEEWRPVEEAPGYQVSSLGRVMGRRGKLLTQTVNQFGYKTVSPYVGGKTLYRQAHRLVAQAFIPNPDGLPLVNHKDGDRLNNVVDNLEWVTAKQNAERIVKPAEDNARRSRKVIQVFPDGHTETWASVKEAAGEARVSYGAMSGMCGAGRTDAEGNRWAYADVEAGGLEGEEWAWVEFPDENPIEVSTLGRIRLQSGQIVEGRVKGNYSRYQKYGVHRLVATAFCDRRPGQNIVNHLDGNPANNCAANLEWTTQQGNCEHAHATGLCRRKPVRRTLPSGQTVDYDSIKEASRLTKVSAGDIVRACKGQAQRAGGSKWEYLPTTTPKAEPPATAPVAEPLATAPVARRLTDEDIAALLEDLVV